jgi:hypothetical protein
MASLSQRHLRRSWRYDGDWAVSISSGRSSVILEPLHLATLVGWKAYLGQH